MKFIKRHELICSIIFYSCLLALLTEIFPPIKSFFIWLLPEKDPQLIIITSILSFFTYQLVKETRKLSEFDKEPWLFLDKIIFDHNGRLWCTFKNVGKVPIIYEVKKFEVAINNKSIPPIEPFHNKGSEVFQGKSQDFIFGFMKRVNLKEITDEIIKKQQQRQSQKLYKGSFEIFFKYSRSDGVFKKNVIKKYALEISPKCAQKENNPVLNGFFIRRFEIKS